MPDRAAVMLDTVVLVETPEGVALTLRAAGVLPRSLAWAIDALLRLVAISAVGTVLALLGDAGEGLFALLLFGVFWGYNVLFEVLTAGQTPGKRALGLRVINGNGTPVGWLPSVVRNLMRTVDMLPFGYGFGVVAGLFDGKSRRLGDMVAGTVVVHADRTVPRPRGPGVPAIDPPAGLPVADKAAIVAFAERAPQLTDERCRELAELVPALTGPTAQPVERLLGMASAILGRRT